MATRNPAPGTCMVEIFPTDRWDWGKQREKFCGRPVKGTSPKTDQPVCGIHLRTDQNAVEKDGAQSTWKSRIRALEGRYGYISGWEAGKPVGVQLAALERVAGELERLQARVAALETSNDEKGN